MISLSLNNSLTLIMYEFILKETSQKPKRKNTCSRSQTNTSFRKSDLTQRLYDSK